MLRTSTSFLVLLYALTPAPLAFAQGSPASDLSAALRLLRQGKAGQAERIGRRILVGNRNPALSARVWALVGRAEADQGDCPGALRALRSALRQPSLPADELTKARLTRARCLRILGRLDEARGEAELLLGQLRGRERAEAFEIIAAAALARGLTARAAQALHRAWKTAPVTRRPALRALAAKLRGPNEAELRFAHDALPKRGFPAGYLALRLAESAFAAGRLADAKAYLKRARSFQGDNPPLQVSIERVQSQIDGRTLPAPPPPTQPPTTAQPAPAVPSLPPPRTTPTPSGPPASAVATSPVATPSSTGTASGSSTAAPAPGTTSAVVSPPPPPKVPAGPRPRVRLAVLAPLSGPAQEIGARIRRGAEIAQKLEQGARIEVLFRDTRGDPEEAKRQIEELARDPLVMAVVGPVLARPAVAAARRAQELGVPLVGLSAALGLTTAGDYVFRVFLTPQRQAQTVARYAVKTLKLRRLGILHPQSGYGFSMANAFRAEAVRLGARVVGVLSYGRGQRDFSKQARAMRGWGIDGLFFPDGYRTVALAAGYLAAGGLPIGAVAGKKREVRLLGTNEWYAGDLIRLAKRYLQRAVLAVGFSLHSQRVEAREFLRAFRAAFQSIPTYVEAFAYDAVRTVGTLFARGSAADRASLQRALEQADLQGATGRIRFGAQREITTPLEMVEISGNAFGAAGRPPGSSRPKAAGARVGTSAQPSATETREERALREALRRALESSHKRAPAPRP